MDQKQNSKESVCPSQPPPKVQSFNSESSFSRFTNDINSSHLLMEEEINTVFKQRRKLKINSKDKTDFDLYNYISIEELIHKNTQFFETSFMNISDKQILFAAFGMIHQFYLSSAYALALEHMFSFSTLWITYVKSFNILKFDEYKVKMEEIIQNTKTILDKNKEIYEKNDDYKNDFNEIIGTFSLLDQICQSVDSSDSNKSEMIEKSIKAIDNALMYLNNLKNLPIEFIQQIQSNFCYLQQLLKSQLNAYNLKNYVMKISNTMLSIPGLFDRYKINLNAGITNDPTFLRTILKTIINFYQIYFRLMINVTDWKEAKLIFNYTQKLYILIEQPLASSSPTSKYFLKKFKEKILALVSDRSLKDNQTIKELNAVISILPAKLYHIRSSFLSFLYKRKEILTEYDDSQKIFTVYQACINFISKLNISNGPIYTLTYKLLLIYSKALINSIIYEYLETISNFMNRLYSIEYRNLNTKKIDSSIHLELSKLLKSVQDFLPCRIVSDEARDFLTRFELLTFFLKTYLAISPSSSINNIIHEVLPLFPNFQNLKKSIKWINDDLTDFFRSKEEVIKSHLSEFQGQPTDIILSAYGSYGQILKEMDIERIHEYKKYFRFKKHYDDFSSYLNRFDNQNSDEILIEPNEFSTQLVNILQQIKAIIVDKHKMDTALKSLLDISLHLIYQNYSYPDAMHDIFCTFLKSFQIPLFNQNFAISFRYSELLMIMKNEREIKDDGSNFCESIIKYCSFLDENLFDNLFQLYPALNELAKPLGLDGFENMLDTVKKFNGIFNDINQFQLAFYTSKATKTNFVPIDIISFYNLLETISKTLEKLLSYQIVSKDSIALIEKIQLLCKEKPYSFLHFFYSYGQQDENDENEKSADAKKSMNLKEFIQTFSKLLFILHEKIQFQNVQKFFKNKLSIIISMLSSYMNCCYELEFLKPYCDEFIHISNLMMNNFTPILYRMHQISNIIFSSLKKKEKLTYEVSTFEGIITKIHINILNALNIISIKKDMKIVLNFIKAFSMKYNIEGIVFDYQTYPIENFFNFQTINSNCLSTLHTSLKNLYSFDVKISPNPKNLQYSEIYNLISPTLPTINKLFDEATFDTVKLFFEDGCKQLDLLTDRLESNISIIDKNIEDEKIKIKLLVSQDQNEEEENSTLFDEPNFDSFLGMYHSILQKKLAQNKSQEKNIAELKQKIEKHNSEFNDTNNEFISFTSNLIPNELTSYSKTLLEPLKNFQAQEPNESDDSSSSNLNDDSNFDAFSRSELNNSFIKSILLKINELENQNKSLMRFINVQSFYSVVENYMKTHKNKNSPSEINDKNSSIQEDDEKMGQKKVKEDDNKAENEEDDDNEYEYEYEYEYAEDESRNEEFDEFDQDEIKLIMLINSLRNCGKNKGTLRELVSSNFKESIGQIELSFYKLIEKASLMFNFKNLPIEEIQEDEKTDKTKIVAFNEKVESKKSYTKWDYLRIARSLVQDVLSDV